MKKIFTVICVIIIAAMLTSCSSSDEKLGLVNGEQMSRWQYDLTKAQGLNSIASNYGLSAADMTEDLKAALMPSVEQSAWDSEVANRITLQEAKAQNVTVTEEELQKVLDEQVIASFESDEAYQSWLENLGITEEQLKEFIASSQLNSKLYDKITADVTVSEAEAKADYEADPTKWDERKVSHILITATSDGKTEGDPATDEEALALAKDLIARLNNGEDFAALAKEYSDDTYSAVNGGVLDQFFTAVDTSLMPEFVAGSFAISKVGGFSQEPVQTSYGYHIIKLDEEKKGFDVLKESMVKTMNDDAKGKKYSDYMYGKVDEAKVERLIDFEYWTEGNTDIPLHMNFFQKVYHKVAGWFGGSDAAEDGTATEDGAVTDDGAATDESTEEDTTTAE